jgi:hypothetical protein
MGAKKNRCEMREGAVSDDDAPETLLRRFRFGEPKRFSALSDAAPPRVCRLSAYTCFFS